MASAYFTQSDLEARLSATTVSQVFDDDNSGSSDVAPIALLIADASSKVDSYLRGTYSKYMPFETVPNEVKRLALDVAVAFVAQRHPEVVRMAWKELMDAAEADLAKLRDGKTRLDVADAVPANAGGGVIGDDETTSTAQGGILSRPLHFYVDGLEDF